MPVLDLRVPSHVPDRRSRCECWDGCDYQQHPVCAALFKSDKIRRVNAVSQLLYFEYEDRSVAVHVDTLASDVSSGRSISSLSVLAEAWMRCACVRSEPPKSERSC